MAFFNRRPTKARFLHLLDLKNLRVVFSKDEKGIRVEACESKTSPPYVATVKFSFYMTEEEYGKIAKKHKNIVNKMMGELDELSDTIEKMYRKKRSVGGKNGG
jgi:hypothetical protein